MMTVFISMVIAVSPGRDDVRVFTSAFRDLASCLRDEHETLELAKELRPTWDVQIGDHSCREYLVG